MNRIGFNTDPAVGLLAVVAALSLSLTSLSGCAGLSFLQYPGAGEREPEDGALDVITERVGTGTPTQDEAYGPEQSDAPVVPEIRVPESERATFERLVARKLDVRYTEQGILVTLSDSAFEFGSARLTDEARRQVREIAEVLLHEARGRAIAVEGHTDSIGAELYNQGFSKRRARSVAAVLLEQGVSKALLTVGGYGSAYPVAPNDNADGSDNAEGRRKNRRVEILIEK